MLIMICDLCGERTEDSELVEVGPGMIADACPRCIKIIAIATIGHPAETAWMN